MPDIIVFHGNPWPSGHRIVEFVWSGRLEPETGLWFDLHLKTEDYYANDPVDEVVEEPDDIEDWKSKAVWSNYHQCFLTSTAFNPPPQKGFIVGTETNKLDFSTMRDRVFQVDPLDLTKDSKDFSFGIYLLGHDAVAGHRIQFLPSNSPAVFDVSWRGSIALAYVGDDEFRYSFTANIKKVKFSGFQIPEGCSRAQAMNALARVVTDPSRFVQRGNTFKIKTGLFGWLW